MIQTRARNKPNGMRLYTVAALVCLIMMAFSGISGLRHIKQHSHYRWQRTLDSVFLLENLRHHIHALYDWQEKLLRSEDTEFRFLAGRKIENSRSLLEQSMEQCTELIAGHISEDEYRNSREVAQHYLAELTRLERFSREINPPETIDEELLALRSLQEILTQTVASLRRSLINNIREEDRLAFEKLLAIILIGLTALFILLLLVITSVIKQHRTEQQLYELNQQLEQRVRDRTTELQESSRELDAFVSSVSYDIRAPLRRIDQYSMAIAEDYQDNLPDEAAGFIIRIRQLTNEALIMVENLLALSRIATTEVNRTEVDLGLIAKDIVRDMNLYYTNHSPDIRIQPGLLAQADATLIRIVVFNLLDNAFKFTSKTNNPTIEFGVIKTRKDVTTFFVRDNGPGYEPRYADKLFRAFERLHSNTEYPGNGMGLVTAARIINKHGGSIRAESAPGNGATFFFTLSD